MPKQTRRPPLAGTVDDPTISFVELEIEGQSYKLAYDFMAIARAEGIVNGLRATGEEKINLVHGLAGLLSGIVNETFDPNSPALAYLDARQALGLFHASLLIAQPKITLQETARLMLPLRLDAISAAVIQAYLEYMPEVRKLRKDPTSAANEGGASPSVADAISGDISKPAPGSTSA